MHGIKDDIRIKVETQSCTPLSHVYFFLRGLGLGGCFRFLTSGVDFPILRFVLLAEAVRFPDTLFLLGLESRPHIVHVVAPIISHPVAVKLRALSTVGFASLRMNAIIRPLPRVVWAFLRPSSSPLVGNEGCDKLYITLRYGVDNLALIRRLRLTFASAASTASFRCNSDGTRTVKTPE